MFWRALSIPCQLLLLVVTDFCNCESVLSETTYTPLRKLFSCTRLICVWSCPSCFSGTFRSPLCVCWRRDTAAVAQRTRLLLGARSHVYSVPISVVVRWETAVELALRRNQLHSPRLLMVTESILSETTYTPPTTFIGENWLEFISLHEPDLSFDVVRAGVFRKLGKFKLLLCWFDSGRQLRSRSSQKNCFFWTSRSAFARIHWQFSRTFKSVLCCYWRGRHYTCKRAPCDKHQKSSLPCSRRKCAVRSSKKCTARHFVTDEVSRNEWVSLCDVGATCVQALQPDHLLLWQRGLQDGARVLVEGLGRALVRRVMGFRPLRRDTGVLMDVFVGVILSVFNTSARLWCHDHLFKLFSHQKGHREVLSRVVFQKFFPKKLFSQFFFFEMFFQKKKNFDFFFSKYFSPNF